MATQNPIESEGTYPLPEAQVDRFLMKILVDYPTPGEEAAVVGRSLRRAGRRPRVPQRSPTSSATRARPQTVLVDREVIGYAVALADATRHPGGARPRRPRAADRVRREPARADRAGPGGARAGAAARPRPRRRARTSATSPPTCCATGSCSPTTRSARASPSTQLLERDPGRRPRAARRPRRLMPARRRPGGRPRARRERARPLRSQPPAARQGPGPMPRALLDALDVGDQPAGRAHAARRPARGRRRPRHRARAAAPVRARRRRPPHRRRRERAHRRRRTCACTCPSAR